MEDQGLQLFDVISHQRLKNIAEATDPLQVEIFDSDYYDDQSNPALRTHFIEVMKVTKEYFDQQKALQKSKSAKYTRLLSAFGTVPDNSVQDEGDLSEEETTCEESTETELAIPPSTNKMIVLSCDNTELLGRMGITE